jgi:methionyl-tRNA synthetase
VPFGQDGNYSHEAIIQRINADLANDLGNLAQRSLSMIAKNCGGAVPDWREAAPTAEDLELLAQADALVAAAREHMKAYAIHQYLGAIFDVVAKANRYFANSEPWKLAKSDPARMRLVLYATIETLRIAAILLQPVLPAAMGKLLDLLGVSAQARDFAALGGESEAGRIEASHRLKPGAALPPPAPVFPRYVEPEADSR